MISLQRTPATDGAAAVVEPEGQVTGQADGALTLQNLQLNQISSYKLLSLGYFIQQHEEN